MSEVRGRSLDDPMHEGQWTRGINPPPRSGAMAEYQTAMAQKRPRGVNPCPRPGAAARRSNPTPEARGGGQEDQSHILHGSRRA